MNEMRYDGVCPICETRVTFAACSDWYRDTLLCTSCEGGSLPRERALALALADACPDWRGRRIHESSPMMRGISLKLQRQAPGYLPTHFFPDAAPGAIVNGVRCENLEAMTFADASFDLVITQDVMEHVRDPRRVIKEIHRTLVQSGVYICCFPVRKHQAAAMERRCEFLPDGTRVDFKDPEIHGNPVNQTGSIVTVDWGYDLHQLFAEWGPFDVRVTRFADRTHGVLGEYTDVVTCRKPR
jgi:SAM-dependent methyltransferase